MYATFILRQTSVLSNRLIINSRHETRKKHGTGDEIFHATSSVDIQLHTSKRDTFYQIHDCFAAKVSPAQQD